MKAKTLEIRDVATFIAILAVDMNPDTFPSAIGRAQHWLLRRCGYPCDGRPNVLICRLDGSGKASNDPYAWDNRTLQAAHQYIIDHWDYLHDGDVVDVQFILGETSAPKVSERITTKGSI